MNASVEKLITIEELITRLRKDGKGAYMAFNESLWGVIESIAERKNITGEKVILLAIKEGLNVLIDSE